MAGSDGSGGSGGYHFIEIILGMNRGTRKFFFDFSQIPLLLIIFSLFP